MAENSNYYVPAQSKLPLVSALFLLFMFLGLGHLLNSSTYDNDVSWPVFALLIGLASLLVAVYYWFRIVVFESRHNMHSEQMDRSYRLGMSWFIYTEVMFFLTFFGSLFYARYLGVPWLSAEGDKASNILLWPEFIGTWPLFETPDPTKFQGPEEIINPLGVPLLNTIILVSSSFTLTWGHHALRANNRKALTYWLATTIALGVLFLYLQAEEYIHAYTDLGLTFASGIYGNLFFLLTGFHGAHVTLGSLMLITMLVRVMKGHFTPNKHFAFEASSWYWHFVDVVWIGLFLLVYIL